MFSNELLVPVVIRFQTVIHGPSARTAIAAISEIDNLWKYCFVVVVAAANCDDIKAMTYDRESGAQYSNLERPPSASGRNYP